MDGYFWIERGNNMCGVASCASFPDMENSDGDGNIAEFI